jgi:hypothetical protein
MSDVSKPKWWSEVELPVFDTEEEQTAAKVQAAGHVLGFMLNVPADSDDGKRLRTWFAPEDFPGPFMLIAQSIWEDYDGDVEALVLRMVREGVGGRIRNGVLVTDLYWRASFAAEQEASFILSRIRMRERMVAQAQAQIASIAPFAQG